MRAELWMPCNAPKLALKALTCFLICSLAAIFSSACATKTTAPGTTSLRMKISESQRQGCAGLAPPSVEELQKLAAITPAQVAAAEPLIKKLAGNPTDPKTLAALQYVFAKPINDYMWVREAGHEGARAQCENRGDTFVVGTDRFNKISDELEKKRGK